MLNIIKQIKNKIFNKKPKDIKDIAYKLFLKKNRILDSAVPRTLFNSYYDSDSYHYKEACLIIRNKKINRIKKKLNR